MLKKELSTLYSQGRQGLIIEGLITVEGYENGDVTVGYDSIASDFGDFSGDKNLLKRFFTSRLSGYDECHLACVIRFPNEVIVDDSIGFCLDAEIISKDYTWKGFFVPLASINNDASATLYPGIKRDYVFVFSVPNKIGIYDKASETFEEKAELNFPCNRISLGSILEISVRLMRDNIIVYDGSSGVAYEKSVPGLTPGESIDVSVFVDLSNIQSAKGRVLMEGGGVNT